MRWFSLLAILVAAGAGGLWIWHGKSQIRYQRDRATLEWQGAKLAEKVQSVGSVPDAWSAGLFLSDKSLRSAASTLKGMRIASEKDDLILTFDDLSIRSKPSSMEVEIALSASSPSRNASLKAKAVAELVFMGTIQKDEQTVILRFGLVPIEILPEIAWYGFDLKGSKLASDLVAGEILAGMINSAPIELPVPNGFSAELGGERTGTIPINKDLSSKLTYSLTVPPLKLAGSLLAVSPLFLQDGLWLLASERPVDGLLAVPDPAGRSRETLVAETKELQMKLQTISRPAGDAAIWIGSKLLLSTLNSIAQLSSDKRRVTFRSTKVEGRIAEKKWRDDILGDGGTFAEFVDDNAVVGHAFLSGLTPKWVPNVGIDLDAQLDAHAEAKVHVHVDPLIGGGVGTSVGLVGDASAALGGSIAFTVDVVEDARVLVARPKGRCDSLTITMATDGKAKTDFGWTTVPSIGIIRHQPIDLSVIGPTTIFDDLPLSLSARDVNGKVRATELKGRKLTIEPAWQYVNARISVVEAKALNAGWSVGANIQISPARSPVDPEDLAKRRAMLRSKLTQSIPSSCAEDGSTEITLGNTRFGPNNELVKFFVAIGKFTKEMAERIGHEVSTDKLKEWARDPAGSFARSDPGKAAKSVVDTVSQPVRSYCAHNWCP